MESLSQVFSGEFIAAMVSATCHRMPVDELCDLADEMENAAEAQLRFKLPTCPLRMQQLRRILFSMLVLSPRFTLDESWPDAARVCAFPRPASAGE